MKNKLFIFFITLAILTTIFAIVNNLETSGKNTTVYDEVINVYVDIWYYTFVFPNGTSITFNWDNNTATHLTLYTGLNYLLNITNTGTYEHGMRFTNNATNAVPFNFDIKASTVPYYDAVNFTSAGFYTVTCANYGNCGQHHAQMNFNIWVVDNSPSSLSSSSSSTATVTNIIISTSNVTQISNVTIPVTQNITVVSTLTEITTQTQSLFGMSAITTIFGSMGLVLMSRYRNRKK